MGTVGCPSCGEENPERARFCLACGVRLQREPDGEARKVVSMVFVDMVGSTPLGERTDPESLRRVMDRFFVTMRAVVEEHGGVVAKFIGDAVLAVWGMRDVAEDDALRAVRAAGAMRDALAGLNDELERAWGVRLGIRTGVNTGEVIVDPGRAAETLVGDAMNVGARLEQAAAEGEVLIGPETYRLVRGQVALEEIAPLTLKGKHEPLRAWRLLSHAAPTAAPGATPLVARERELARLLAAFDTTVAERGCRVATVIGSPGIGKTRLAAELAAVLRERATIVTGRCQVAGEGATFLPLAEALRAALGLGGANDAQRIREVLVETIGADGDGERIADRVAGVLGHGAPAAAEETFWAVRRLLEALAVERPLLLVLEDVHWAQATLLDLVEHLADWGRGAPVLVLCLARPELRELRPRLAEADGDALDAIALDPLDADSSRALVGGLLGESELPPELAAEILRASEGNPLYLGEMVRMLVDDGVLRREGDRWVAHGDIARVNVPPTINALLAARLERLGGEERSVVERASVVGHEFPHGAVAELAPPEVRAGLDDHLVGLTRKELVAPEVATWLDERLYRFHHVLIRDAAYRRLLKEARADLHERYAGWLESKPGEHDELVGFHLEHAYRYREQLGPLDDAGRDLGARAAGRLHAAGHRALARDDLPAATGLLSRARALVQDDAARAGVLVDLAEAVLSAGDTVTATAVVEALALAAGDERLRARAEVAAAHLDTLTGEGGVAETIAALERAAATLRASGDAAGEAKAHHVAALAHASLGQVAAAEAALDRALVAARAAGDQRRVTAVLSGAPRAALWGPSPIVRASGRCLDVVRILRMTDGTRHVEAAALRCQAVLEAMRGRAAAARQILATSRAVLEELGLRYELCELDVHAGIVELLDDDPAAAEAALRAAVEGFRGLGAQTGAAGAEALLARALLAQRRDAEAEELTHLAEQHAGEDLKATIGWLGARAEALARRGQHDDALALARRAWSLAEPTDALADKADALMALARVLQDSGDHAAAVQAATQARELYAQKEHSVGVALAQALAGTAGRAPIAGVISGGGRPICDWIRRRAPAFADRFNARAWDDIRAATADHYVARDRRSVSMASVDGPDALIEGLRSTLAPIPDARMEIVALAGAAVAGGHVGAFDVRWSGHQAETGEPVEIAYIALSRFEGELLSYHEFWDPEDLEAALARYDELAQERPVTPFVRRRAIEAMRWFNERDWDAYRAGLADVVITRDRRTVAAIDAQGPEERIEHLRSVLAVMPDARMESTPIAGAEIPGGHVGVFHGVVHGHWAETGEPAELDFLVVNRFDGEKLAHDELFEGHERAAALAAFDEIVAAAQPASADNDAVRLARALVDAVNRRDFAALEEILSDDLVCVDVRRASPLGGEADRATYIERMRLLTETGSEVSVSIDEIILSEGNTGAGISTWHGRVPEGGEFATPMINLMRARGEQIELVVIFDPEDRENVQRHFAALASGAPYWLVRWLEEYRRSFNERDWTALRALYAPDFRVTRWRRLSSPTADDEGVEGVIAAGLSAVSVCPDLVAGLRLVRPRCDSLGGVAVVEFTFTGTSTTGGAVEHGWFSLFTFAEQHTLTTAELFDEESAAIARLADLSGAREMPAAVRERVAAIGERFNLHDWATLARGFSEDVLWIDERSGVNTGVMRGRDSAIAYLRAFAEVIGDVRWQPEAIAGAEFDGDVMLVGWIARMGWGQTREGAGSGEIEGGFVQLFVAGRAVYFRVLDGDDAPALLHSYEQLRAALAAGFPWWAAIWLAEWARRINTRDWDALTELYDADYRLVSHRTLPWAPIDSVDATVANQRSFIETSLTAEISARPIAWVGDGAIVEIELRGTNEAGGEFLYSHFNTGVFRDRRLVLSENFDDEAAASARLDELARTSDVPAAVRERLEAFVARINAREWEALRQAWADDVLYIDDRPGTNAGLSRGGDAMAAQIRQAVAVAGDATWAAELLAGAEVAGAVMLVAWIARISWEQTGDGAGSGEIRAGFVQIVVAGRAVYFRVLDGDDRGALLARYEQLRAALAAGFPWWAAIWIVEWERRVGARDWDALAELYDPEYRFVSHRALPWAPIEGVDETIANQRSFFENSRAFEARAKPIAGFGDDDGDGAVLAELELQGINEAGGEFLFSFFDTVVFRDRRLVLSEHFDDERSARARLEELRRERPALPPRLAAGLERWLTALRTRDWEAFAACYARGGHRFVDHRPLDGQISGSSSGAESAQLWRTRLELAPDLTPRFEMLDVAGERLTLSRVRFESQAASIPGVGASAIDVLQIVEVDDQTRITLIEYFGPDDEASARARLDELRLPAFVLEWARRLPQLFDARDWDALREMYTEDCRLDDHRRLSWDNVHGVAASLDALRSALAVSPDARFSFDVLAGFGDDEGNGAAALRTRWGGTYEGGDAEIVYHSAATFRGGRQASTEHFDDEASALARLEELRRDGVDAPSFAQEWAWRVLQAIETDDWGAVRALYADEYRDDDHRQLGWEGHESPEALLETLRSGAAMSRDLRVRFDVLAADGGRDGAAAMRVRWEGTNEHGGPFQIVWHNILVFRDGLAVRGERFDDEASALARLDELRVPPFAVEWARRWSDAFNARDWDAMPEVYADDYRLDDHRRLPWASYEGVEAAVDEMRSAVAMSADIQVSLEVRAGHGNDEGDGAAVAMRRWDGTDEHGGAWQIVMPTVLTFREGRLARTEMFDDEATALARLEELRPPQFAVTWARRWTQLVNARDWDALPEVYAEGYRFDDRRALPWPSYQGVDEAIATIRSGVAVSADMRVSLDVVRGHGDADGNGGAAMTLQLDGTDEHGGAWQIVMHSIFTFREGRLAKTEQFDDEATALARLEELRAPGAAEWIDVLFAEYERAYSARDWDAIGALLHDDFEAEDHRPVSLARVPGARGFLDLLKGLGDQAPDLRLELTRLAAHQIGRDDHGVAAARADVRGTTDGGGPVEIVHSWAVRLEGRRIRRFHVFTSDAEALARCERWRRALEAGVPSWGLDFAERAEHARNSRDWPGFAALFTHDATIQDHRALGWGTLDPASLIAMLQSGIELASDAGMEIEPLAGHGDDAGNGALLMYLRGHGNWDTGGPLELVFYGVARCVAGRGETLEMYDDESAARERLHALRPA